MRTTLLLLLALLVTPAEAQLPVAAPASFDAALAAKVFAAGLAFVVPRSLDPTTPPELTLWGLQGLSAIDPSLTPELRDGRLRLTMVDRVLFTAAPAPADDPAGWGRLAAAMAAAGWSASLPLRRAGTQGIIQSFFDEMFNHLDPYSRYVPPQAAAVDRDQLAGDAGVGITLVREGSAVVISDIVPGGPGEAAGLRIGDRVLSIDGRPARGSLAALEQWLQGPPDSSVVIIVRGRDGVLRQCIPTRAPVPPETVFSGHDRDLLVIRVSAFYSNTAERLSQAIEAGLLGRRPRALVLDLRADRGGLLRQAVTSVALLLEQGVVASTVGRDPEATHDWRVEGGDLTHGLPLVVLVDGRTASAAEIVAAALADQHRAVVVGSATLGKGLVQTLTQLPDGGELFVTWSRVLAPLGWPLQGLGVMPQVCTSLGSDVLEQQLGDLAAGVEDLAAALAASRAARPPLPEARILQIRAACPATEGGPIDMIAARFLAEHPAAYQTALYPPQPPE